MLNDSLRQKTLNHALSHASKLEDDIPIDPKFLDFYEMILMNKYLKSLKSFPEGDPIDIVCLECGKWMSEEK